MKIILIGFMGSGKTSVAKKLGEFLVLPIIEMDELVYQKTHTTNMHEVFAKGGESLLRETESAIAKEYSLKKNLILSTGGGAVLNKVIMDNLKGCEGQIFYLNTSFETLAKRLAQDQSRPLFKNVAEAKSLYLHRMPLYLKYADHVIEAENKSVNDIALEIVKICT